MKELIYAPYKKITKTSISETSHPVESNGFPKYLVAKHLQVSYQISVQLFDCESVSQIHECKKQKHKKFMLFHDKYCEVCKDRVLSS